MLLSIKDSDTILRPIADKYREGKVKSTLYEGLKGLEIDYGEGELCDRRYSSRTIV